MTLAGHKKTVSTTDISVDGKHIVSGSYEGIVKIWSLESGDEINSIKAFNRNVASAIFLHDNRTLVVSGLDENIRLYEMKSGDIIQNLTGHKTAVNALTLSREGDFLSSSGYGGMIKIWALKDWGLVHSLNLETQGYYKSAFSPDSKILAVIAAHKVMLFSTETAEMLEEQKLKSKGVTSVTFSHGGQWLAVGAADKKIRLWRMKE